MRENNNMAEESIEQIRGRQRATAQIPGTMLAVTGKKEKGKSVRLSPLYGTNRITDAFIQ